MPLLSLSTSSWPHSYVCITFNYFRKSRKTIDTTDAVKSFGPVEIHYGKVQQKVTLKYDSWHREILSRFGTLLGDDMHDFHNTISKVC